MLTWHYYKLKPYIIYQSKQALMSSLFLVQILLFALLNLPVKRNNLLFSSVHSFACAQK